MHGNWNYPTSIRFGTGRVVEAPAALTQLGVQRPLLVTGPGLVKLPLLGQVREALASLPTAVFSGARPNPCGEDVLAGVAAYKQHDADGVVALGGGSALDVGKAIALMVGQSRPMWDFEDVGDNWRRVDAAAMAPVLAIPTTAGTGSEVGRSSVIIDAHSHTKRILFHPGMLPGQVICDPALTVGLPPKLTAAVGMDALSHNLEAFCVDGFHPMADGIALEAMRRIARSLRRAVADGSDIDARAEMMVASTMGATAFQKGLGAMHSLAHPLGAVFGVHHGLANAIVMPYVLSFNQPAIGQRMAALARTLDLPGGDFDAVLDWVLALRAELGIPHTLASTGLTEAAIPDLARRSLEDPTAPSNPVPLTAEGLEGLFRAALVGS